MTTDCLKKDIKIMPSLAEKIVEISLRKLYLEDSINKKFKDDCFDIYKIDAYIGLVNILLFDFYHCTANICFETNKKALSARIIYNHIQEEFIVNKLRDRWTHKKFFYFLKNMDEYTKNFHEKLDIDMDFNILLNEIMELGKKIYVNNKYITIKTIRDKITGHYELKTDGNHIRIMESKDIKMVIHDSFELFDILFEMIQKMYLIFTGGKYRTEQVVEHQKRMSKSLAYMLPINI